MPAAPIDVDPDVYLSAGDLFLQVNDAVCDLVASAATAAGEGGGMAGTDSGGVDWASAYDEAAATALQTGATLTDSLGHLGELLSTTAANHSDADASSTVGGPPSYPGSGGGPGAVSILPAAPPSANATDDNPPTGWFLIAHLLEYTWPNGHQDTLRRVAGGWADAAAGLDAEADRLTRAIADVSALQSPEVDAAVATCSQVQQSTRSLSDSFTALGTACSDYASHLDEAHSAVIEELIEFAAQSVGIQVLSAVAAPFTAGGSEVAGQAAQAARAALTATKVSRILQKLLDVVRAVTTTVRTVLTRIREVLSALKGVLAKGGTKAVEEAAPALQKVASGDVRKFSEYVLSPTKNKGKLVIYEKYGYSAKDAEELVQIYTEQAATKFQSGDFTLGVADQYGQRITIDIDLPGKGAAAGNAGIIKSGWIINPDGTIRLTTPFAG